MTPMKNKTITLFVIAIFFVQILNAQNGYGSCGRKVVDCAGLCGAFVDTNGDGFCDYGLLSSQQTTTDNEQVIAKDTSLQESHNPSNCPKHITNNEIISVNDTSSIQTSENDSIEVIKSTSNEKDVARNNPYHFLLITILTFSLYFLSMLLVRLKLYKKFTHRRIWNLLLLLTFIMSGILGIILTIQITYGVWLGIYRDFLILHVEFGIAMGFIAIIHALWHWKYFRNLLSSSANKGKCE